MISDFFGVAETINIALQKGLIHTFYDFLGIAMPYFILIAITSGFAGLLYFFSKKSNKPIDLSSIAKYTSVFFFGVIISFGIIGIGQTGISQQEIGKNKIASTAKLGGIVCVEHIDKNGKYLGISCEHNLITNRGLNWTRDLLSGLAVPSINSSTNNWTAMLLSNDGGTISVDNDTCPSPLTTSGFSAGLAGTIIRQNTGNYTISKTFSPTATFTGIRLLCIGNTSSAAPASPFGGSLMAIANFSSTNVESGDTLIVNYSLLLTNNATGS